jgi:hypothetical protein
MTLPRLAAMQEYWQRNPPAHIAIRSGAPVAGSGKVAPQASEEEHSAVEVGMLAGMPVNTEPIPQRFLDAMKEDNGR